MYMLDIIQTFDSSVLLWIQENFRNFILDPFMIAYTSLGNYSIIWLILAAVMIYFPKTRKAGILVLLAIVLGYLINNFVLKDLIERPRPWIDISALEPLIYASNPNSFPSGHTCIAFAVSGIICRTQSKSWALASIAAAILMGFSRLYVGVHYPTDVIAGAIVGIIGSQIIWYIYTSANKKTHTVC